VMKVVLSVFLQITNQGNVVRQQTELLYLDRIETFDVHEPALILLPRISIHSLLKMMMVKMIIVIMKSKVNTKWKMNMMMGYVLLRSNNC